MILEALTDTTLTAEVGAAIPVSPKVRVRRQEGGPVPGVRVHFTTGGGSTVSATVAASDANGMAVAKSWVMGTVPGPTTLRASIPTSSVTFRATATPGAPRVLEATCCVSQLGLVNMALPQPLSVRVKDGFGNPIPGSRVTFQVVQGGGDISVDTTRTDARGIATSTWSLGASPGIQRAVATLGHLRQDFRALACAGSCPPNEFAYSTSAPVGSESAILLGSIGRTGVLPPVVDTVLNTGGRTLAWSPDGQRMAFVRYEGFSRAGTDQFGIWIHDLRTGGTTRFMDGAYPVWSPDGRRLAMSRSACSYACTSLVVDLADTTRQVMLPTNAAYPAWSPDGSRIAFVRLSYDDGNHALVVSNADGSAQRDVMRYDRGELAFPSWSPDGTFLLFVRHGDSGAFVVRADGSDAQNPRLVSPSGNVESASWSPDGAWILLSLATDPGGSIAIVSATGGEAFDLELKGWHPRWRPRP